MGDRAEVKFTYGEGKGDIFLYTHWGGSELPIALRDALIAGKGRWGDESYLTRIVVSQIVGDHWQSETGYGLSPEHLDSEYGDLQCDVASSTITIKGESFPFEDYVTMSDSEILALWG